MNSSPNSRPSYQDMSVSRPPARTTSLDSGHCDNVIRVPEATSGRAPSRPSPCAPRVVQCLLGKHDARFRTDSRTGGRSGLPRARRIGRYPAATRPPTKFSDAWRFRWATSDRPQLLRGIDATPTQMLVALSAVAHAVMLLYFFPLGPAHSGKPPRLCLHRARASEHSRTRPSAYAYSRAQRLPLFTSPSRALLMIRTTTASALFVLTEPYPGGMCERASTDSRTTQTLRGGRTHKEYTV
ncbi:hypothetical protein BV20DRAFT_703390 [Pilatotrama ljubarskyi]|nr:hypothetical protein BV20DRAFT_703390 [Pilatotrama ljubarskyi]